MTNGTSSYLTVKFQETESQYGASSFAGSIWFMPFFPTYGVSFGPLGVGYRATNVFDSR